MTSSHTGGRTCHPGYDRDPAGLKSDADLALVYASPPGSVYLDSNLRPDRVMSFVASSRIPS